MLASYQTGLQTYFPYAAHCSNKQPESHSTVGGQRHSFSHSFSLGTLNLLYAQVGLEQAEPCMCRHLAASEGCYSISEWLLSQGANINAVDRFKRTPLEV